MIRTGVGVEHNKRETAGGSGCGRHLDPIDHKLLIQLLGPVTPKPYFGSFLPANWLIAGKWPRTITSAAAGVFREAFRMRFCAFGCAFTVFPRNSTRGTTFKQETHKIATYFACSYRRKE